MRSPEISVDLPQQMTALEYFQPVDMVLSSKEVPKEIKAPIQRRFAYKHPLDPLPLIELKSHFYRLIAEESVSLNFKIRVAEAFRQSLCHVDKDKEEIDKWENILIGLQEKSKAIQKKKSVYDY